MSRLVIPLPLFLACAARGIIENMRGILTRPSVVAFIALFVFSAIALAGSLTPPGAVSSTMHTLQELYDSISGTFDSSAIVANQNGSLIEHLKYIEENMATGGGGGAGVSSDSLDFDEFVDAMTLDADTSIASAGFTLSSSANLGIGTTTPDQKLDVLGNILASTSGNVDLILNSTGNQDGKYTFRSTSNDGLQILGSESQQLLVIASSGNIGIGAAPTAKLSVRGGIAAGSLILASRSFATITVRPGAPGFINIAGGIGTGGINGYTNAQRITQAGDLVNIGRIQAGEGHFTSGDSFQSISRDYVANGLASNATGDVGDLDGDGDPDIVTLGTRLVLMFNNGQGVFTSSSSYALAATPAAARIGDVNGDGNTDIVVANSAAATALQIFYGNGSGTMVASASFSGLTGTGVIRDVILTDLNGDGQSDVALPSGSLASVSVSFNDGRGNFRPSGVYAISANANRIASADVNGDGKVDLVTGNADGNVSVLINRGDGTFNPRADYATIANHVPYVVLGDISGDGHPDIVEGSANNQNTGAILLNNGDGTFGAASLLSDLGNEERGSNLGDINGDGKLDAVFTADSGTRYRIGNGDGTFRGFISLGATGGNRLNRLVDLNGDGKLDIIGFYNSTPQKVGVRLAAPKTVLFAQTLTGRVSVGTSVSWSKFSLVDNLPGSLASGSFAIRSSNTIASIASISGALLTTGNVLSMLVPASASQPSVDYLVVRDTLGQVYASLGMGGSLTLRGNLFAHGSTVNCTGANTLTQGCIDYAESFPSTDPSLVPGDIVMVDANHASHVIKANPHGTILGIVSTGTAALIDDNAFKSGQLAKSSPGTVPIALAGRVPVRVSLENGSIHPGDHLTLSATIMGAAMKQTKPGMSIGIALESSTAGTVMVFVNTSYWAPASFTQAIASSSFSILTDQSQLQQLFAWIISKFETLLGIEFERGSITTDEGNFREGNFKEVQTDKICIDNTCITESQLRELLQYVK